MKFSGNIVDVHKRTIYKGYIEFEQGRVTAVGRDENDSDYFILPGLIDSHVHVESSMITPLRFGDEAVKHGTIGTVSDAHEIANIMGLQGIEYMIKSGEKSPLYFWFGAPSCVPATSFETSGAVIDNATISDLFRNGQVKYLSEMMNYPGVINGDKDVIKKIETAKKHGLPVDGHAPGLTGDDLRKYINAGISTDHECSTIEEAQEKISLGMNILIREGSAARNLEALKDLYNICPEKLMLCSDDIHPEMLETGHINRLVARLICDGYNVFDVLKSCTTNPVNHYKLEAGLLRIGDNADFIVVEDLSTMKVLETWIKGRRVYEQGKISVNKEAVVPVNRFNSSFISQSDIVTVREGGKVRVIEAFDGELLTKQLIADAGEKELFVPDLKQDILKIVVKDRYLDSPPTVGYIKGFGLKRGAIASSVAHDSHNIICVGTNDSDIAVAVNEIVKLRGGLAVSEEGQVSSMALNIGGIMSDKTCNEVAKEYKNLSEIAGNLGCKLKAPFMTLSFMALLVIPELKISDKGLFDGRNFSLVPLFKD